MKNIILSRNIYIFLVPLSVITPRTDFVMYIRIHFINDYLNRTIAENYLTISKKGTHVLIL